MKIQMSIVGIALVCVFYAISLALLTLLWKGLKNSWLRWSVTSLLAPVLVALPIADEIWIAWQFNELCKDAGVHVTRKVEAAGFFEDLGGGPSTEGIITNPKTIADFEKSGFRFREFRIGYEREEKISHVENMRGQWEVTIINAPTARYHYRHAYQPTPHRTEKPIGWKLGKSEYEVVDSVTREVLGRDTRYIRYAGWIDSLWIGLVGGGVTSCEGAAPMPSEVRYSLPYYVLVPSRKL